MLKALSVAMLAAISFSSVSLVALADTTTSPAPAKSPSAMKSPKAKKTPKAKKSPSAMKSPAAAPSK